MARDWIGRWEGGRVRTDLKGEKVWVIECMRREVRYSISLDVQGEPKGRDRDGHLIPPRVVAAELALFERDPVAYQAACEARDVPGDVVGAPTICAATLKEFAEDRLHGDHPVTPKHVDDMIRSLTKWMVKLRGKDLRKVTLAEYKTHLRTLSPRRHHARDLRSFTHWLRREGRLSSAEDASRDLEIPQPRPKRAQRAVGYSIEQFQALYRALRSDPSRRQLDPEVVQAVRDALCLRAYTGVHHTEIERIASGAWKVRRVDAGEIAGTVVFMHKSGAPHPVSLCAKALAAAERLQKRGLAPEKKQVHRVIAESMQHLDACVKLTSFKPGELRHSFATWADKFGREVRPPENTGVSRDLIRRVMNHRTDKTTSGYYIDTEIPPMVALPLVLENPEDPIDQMDSGPAKPSGTPAERKTLAIVRTG